MPDDREITLGVSVPGADAAAAKFDKVGDSVTGLDQDLEKLADGSTADELGDLPEPLRLAFKRAEAAANEFQKKAEDLSLTGPRDLRKVAVAQTLLNQEIEKAGLEMKKLPPAAQAAFGKLEAAQKSAINTTSRLKAELDDVNVQTKTGVTGFTGFGNAAEAMGGKIGNAAEKLGFVTAAFGAGVAAGQQFNQFAKTDMSEFSEQMDLLGRRAKKFGEVLGELWLEQGKFLTAIATGDWSLLKEAWSDLGETGGKLKDVVATSNDELRKQRDEMKDAAEAARLKAAADAKLADQQKKTADETKKLAEEQKKLKEETDKVTTSIAAQTAELEKQRGIGQESKAGETQASRELKQAQSIASQLEGQVQLARDRVTQLAAAYGEDSSAVKNAVNDLKEYEAALARAQQNSEVLAQKVTAFNAASAASEAEVKKAEDALAGLSAKQSELQKQTTTLSGVTDTFQQKMELSGKHVTTAAEKMDLMRGVQEAVGISTDDVATKTSLMAGVIQATNGPLSAAEIAQQKAGVAAQEHATKQDNVKGAVEAATTALGKLVATDTKPLEKKIDDLLGKVNALTAAVQTATTAMNKLAGSGGEGGGSDTGSISITRSGEGSGPLTGGLGRPKGATGW